MSLTIKRFELTDLDEILTLFQDTVHTINKKDYSQEQLDTWAPKTLDRNLWSKKLLSHISYVAKIGTTLVGFGDATKQGYIAHIYTHKDFQRQGIASAILKKLEDELCTIGISKVFTEASITAKPFFEKHGYYVLKQQEKVHRGLSFINYVMSKEL